MARSALFIRSKKSALTAALLASVAIAPASLQAESGAPLDNHPMQVGVTLDTANTLPARGVRVYVGSSQTLPNKGSGTGNQVYYTGASYAFTDRLSFGIHGETYEDPVLSPVNGVFPTIGMDTYGGSVKYKLLDGANWDMAVQGSVELFRFDTAIFGTQNGSQAENVVGSIKAPITYTMNDNLQFHVTPGVSVFPSDLNGNAFYGTVGYLGAGVSYKATERLTGYGAINVPFVGGNTVTSTGTITSTPVWTVGGRYNLTPKAAMDFYVTNGVGTTPTTSILTHWPTGDEVLVGARLVWTPGRGAAYRNSYRDLTPINKRQRSLQQDGFTIGSADTVEPGVVATSAWYGTGENKGLGLVFSPDQDGQIELYTEDYSNVASVPAGLLPSKNRRYMFGLKLRMLDQNNGDPFTLSGRVLGGRELGTGTPGPGVLFVEALGSMKVSDKLALTVNPKIAAFGNSEIYGAGFGANYALYEGLELIGEVTPTQNANGTVWAAGLRYNIADSGFSVDASASNAVGRNGLGTLVAQDDIKYSLNITKTFDLKRWR